MWGNTLVLGAVGVMILALAVHVQWRAWVLCRGVWPWLRWIVNFIDFWLWLPVVLALLFGGLHIVFQLFPGRPGAWFTAAMIQGVQAYPTTVLGPAAGVILYKGWLLYFLSRWDPARGLFRLPAWPQQPFSRGPQQRKRREFREPLPWDRGPGSW